MSFAAERCTADEVVILRCVSVSFLVVVNEGQYKGWTKKTSRPGRKCLRIGTPSWRSGVPARLLESFDSCAPPGAQSHHHVSKIGELKHAIPTSQAIQFRKR